MATRVIYLDTDDEITSAANRIRGVRERRVGLVLPGGSRVSTSRINFRLLAREAETHGRDLAIVAPEASARALAASAGLPVFASVTEFEDALEHMEALPPADEPPPTPPRAAITDAPPAVSHASPATEHHGWWDDQAAASSTPRPSRASTPGVRGTAGGAGVRARTSMTDTVVMPPPEVREERRRRRVSGLVLAVASVLIVFVVAAGVAAWLFLPTATVTVAAHVDAVGPLELTVRADPLEVSEDVGQGIVPADVVTYELSVSQEFPATGKKISETRASGAVQWTNCDPTRAYTIPSGTIVATNDGEQFATGDDVFLPVAILSGNPPTISCQSRDVGVTARSNGTAGNVDAGTITTVPSDYNSVVIRVTNPRATSGGTHTESKVVVQKDVDAAMTALTKALRDEFTAQLADASHVPAGLTLFAATKSMSSGDPNTDPDALVGQVQPTFTLGMTATGTATAVDQAMVQSIGDRRIRAAVEKDRSLVKDSVSVTVGQPRVDGSAVIFPVTASALEVNSPDATTIRRVVKGLSVDEARERLRDYGDATVDVWPGWVTSITPYDFRLDVEVVSDVPTEPTIPTPTSQPAATPTAVPAVTASPSPATSPSRSATPSRSAAPSGT
jgi:hypothetical protein